MSDYLILSKNTPVAKWENNRLTVLDDQFLPLFLRRVHNADMWLETRAIQFHRIVEKPFAIAIETAFVVNHFLNRKIYFITSEKFIGV